MTCPFGRDSLVSHSLIWMGTDKYLFFLFVRTFEKQVFLTNNGNLSGASHYIISSKHLSVYLLGLFLFSCFLGYLVHKFWILDGFCLLQSKPFSAFALVVWLLKSTLGPVCFNFWYEGTLLLISRFHYCCCQTKAAC